MREERVLLLCIYPYSIACHHHPPVENRRAQCLCSCVLFFVHSVLERFLLVLLLLLLLQAYHRSKGIVLPDNIPTLNMHKVNQDSPATSSVFYLFSSLATRMLCLCGAPLLFSSRIHQVLCDWMSQCCCFFFFCVSPPILPVTFTTV